MRCVRDVMTTDVKTLGRNDKLTVADDLIKSERIRHLLVPDEHGNLEGVVSQRDLFQSALLRALGYGSVARDKVLRSVVVKEVMTEDVETTTPDTPLATAAQVMTSRKIGCLPVVENESLVGILTEGDFVQLVANDALARPPRP